MEIVYKMILFHFSRYSGTYTYFNMVYCIVELKLYCNHPIGLYTTVLFYRTAVVYYLLCIL